MNNKLTKSEQATKLGNHVWYDMHDGLGVDLILRLVTQFELNPNYNHITDMIIADKINAVDKKLRGRIYLYDASKAFKWYKRRETYV